MHQALTETINVERVIVISVSKLTRVGASEHNEKWMHMQASSCTSVYTV